MSSLFEKNPIPWPYKVVGFENVSSDIFAFVKGRTFGGWITGRGFSAGDPITNPVYIIESILRDECFTERDLTITAEVDETHFTCTGLAYSANDFYAGAYIHNITKNATYTITANTGTTITIASDAVYDSGDNIVISNIQGANKIDADSFDDTYTNYRDAWTFDKSMIVQEKAQVYINQLLYESQCVLDRSQGKYRLVAIEEDTDTANVLSKPLYENGKPKVSIRLTSLSDIYSSFRLRYSYDYGKGDYVRSVYQDSRGGDSTLRALCLTAETSYRTKQPFTYQAGFIYDFSTANKLLDKLVRKHAKQRLIIEYYGNVKDHIQYTVGDQTKVDCPSVIPAAYNNNTIFMVTKAEPIIRLGSPEIHLTLEEMY